MARALSGGKGAAVPKHVDRWVIGFLFAVLGLAGLFLASRATDDVMYFTGILLFIVAFVFNFLQVKAVFDRAERGEDH